MNCQNSKCLNEAKPPALYCSLRCREAAKLARRYQRQRLVVDEAPQVPTLTIFGPASQDALTLVSEALLAGQMQSPVWFDVAGPFASWQATPGLVWEVLADGTGKLSLA